MAGPLLRVLIRLKPNKYHRMQIAARYRLIDLFQQIAHDLHLTVDQVLRTSIYRSGPNGYSLLYSMNKTYSSPSFDVSITLDRFGLSSNEELFLDLSELIHCQSQENDQLTQTNESQTASSANQLDSSANVDETLSSNSLPAAKKPLIGQLIRFAVPADNSCLFSSIYFVLHSGKLDLTANKNLRNLVAAKIESDHENFSEAILGRSNSEYSKWIRRDDSWGGGIELAILTQEYEIEICVINTECGGRIDYFGEDRHFPSRVFLLYNNLHYDPVYLITYDVSQKKELIQTKFHRNDETIIALVKDLVEQFHPSPSSTSSSSTALPSTTTTMGNSKNDSHLIHVKL